MTAAAFQTAYEDARPFSPEPFDGGRVVERKATPWPDPDLTVLTGGRTTPPEMPTDLFGSLWPLVRDLAAGAGAPAEYVAVSIIAVAASLVGAKRAVKPFATAGWQEPCILWVASVGDPSSNKSPAIDAATAPLKGMEKELAEQHKEGLIGWHTTAERAKAERSAWQANVKEATKIGAATPSMPGSAVEPDEPQRPRLMVQDGTPEAVMDILAGNPNGILHLRDELAGWLMSFERYSPGGREFWLEAFGGRHFTVDRKSLKAPLFVQFNGVTVLGGIQPEKLSECLLKTADDGLVARFLWAWPDPIRYQRPRALADASVLERVYRRLLGLQPQRNDEGEAAPVVLMLNDAAAAIFEEWIRDNDAAIKEASGLYKGFLGKLRGMVLRLSLVAELGDTFGTRSQEFLAIQLTELSAAVRTRGHKEATEQQLNAGIAFVAAVAPENELEAALAVQMAGCHALTTDLIGRAVGAENLAHMQAFGNMAVKLQRTFTAQIEALARMRGKGQQTVRVEHVTVEAGAQAIVGDVHHHPAGRGGYQLQNEGQRHGTSEPAERTALPSPDPQGNGVPIPGDAERSLPHPRRAKPRRSRRKPERA